MVMLTFIKVLRKNYNLILGAKVGQDQGTELHLFLHRKT